MISENTRKALWMVILQVLLAWMPHMTAHAAEPLVAADVASTGNGQPQPGATE